MKSVASMDSNNWRPAQGGGEPTMDTADWRSQLPPESRQRILNKIMETLKRHLPFSGQEGLMELNKIAVRFEESIYTAATNQSDYLDKISRKMLKMETKTQNTIAASTSNGRNPSDAELNLGNTTASSESAEELDVNVNKESQAILPQIGNQGQSLPIQNKMANKVQASQPLISQNIQNNFTGSSQPQQQQSNSMIHQHSYMQLQPMLQVQQQQLLGQHSNSANMLQNQLIGQQSSITDMQQQQQRLLEQQNILSNLQQRQQLMSQQNSIPNMHHHHQHQPTSLDSTTQIGNVHGGDWQEDVYQKIKAMKEAYLPELNEIYQKIAGKLQQHDSLPEQPKNEQLENLKIFKTMMERIMAFLQIPKSSILPGYMDKLGSYEKQIVSFLNSNRPRELTPLQMHPMQQQQQRLLGQQNRLYNLQQQQQLTSQQNSIPNMHHHHHQQSPSTSLDSTTQIGNVHGGDWQEDVYQKIKAMKEAYLPELNEIFQKIVGELQQHDSLPEQPKNEQLEKLKIFKTMLERFMAFLQVPKSSILPGYKDKLDSYEKQIVRILNSNRPRKLTPLQMHPMQQPQQSQSQVTQVQQQLHSMNLSG